MKANYHTHTWRCNHATGTEKEYVENALKAGLELLGFSDHSPYIFPGTYYSTFRMRMHQFPYYVNSVLELRKAYQGRIEIPLGLELEYYPKLLPKLLPVLREQPLDYLILGMHFVGNEYDAPYSGLSSDDAEHLRRYVDQSIDAMQSGLFTYFAHPDVINFQGDDKVYRNEMKRICREAKSCGVPLEYNLLGLAGGRNYPDIRFWELAAEEGCRVILGRDAHTAEALLDTKTEETAMKTLRTLGIEPLERVELRPIG